MTTSPPFYRVLDSLPAARRRQPPVNDWHPERRGEIDIRIDRDGRWFHQGDPFERLELVRLFASILRRDPDGAFYLVTPVEQLRIQVEDAPFIAVAVERAEPAGRPELVFRTNLGEAVRADEDHPIRVEQDPNGHPRPYLRVRDRLDALIARSVFYELVELARVEPGEHGEQLCLESAGAKFRLGELGD